MFGILNRKFIKESPVRAGFLQASGQVFYVGVFAIVFQLVQSWGVRNDFQGDQVSGMMIFLLVFIFSALVCGVLAFGYPTTLFLAGKKSSAVKTVVWNIFWLFVLLAATSVILVASS